VAKVRKKKGLVRQRAPRKVKKRVRQSRIF
jgi:hypothetical protein